MGRALTTGALRIGEALRVVPKGVRAIACELNAGADALVDGGETGVFTSEFYFLARKPHRSGEAG